MAKKIDYASMFTLRADGRYMGYWHELDRNGEPTGLRHAVYSRDPARLYQKIYAKEHPEVDVLTFKAIAEAWKGVRFESLSYKSVEAYRAPLQRLIDRFGDDPIDEIATRDVNAFLSSLALKGYAKRTVQLHRDMMSQIYNAAIANGDTKYNPCDHASMPKNLSAGTRGIASDEAIAAVKHGLYEPFGLFAFVCLYAGLRRGEALALRYDDIDRAAGVIHVTKAVEFVGNNPHLKEPKTKSGRRDVILLDVLAAAIPPGKGYLFADGGKLLTRDQYRNRWAKYCKIIGHDITAHQLRHGYATLLYEAGVPDKDAQEQLGHANITLTRDVYTHISSKQRSKTAAKLNKYVEDSIDPEAAADDEDATVGQIMALLEGKDAGAIMTRVAAALASKNE